MRGKGQIMEKYLFTVYGLYHQEDILIVKTTESRSRPAGLESGSPLPSNVTLDLGFPTSRT